MTHFLLSVVHRCKGGTEMPNTSKTVLVPCKEATQLLAGKTQKSQTEPSCETSSMLSLGKDSYLRFRFRFYNWRNL